MSEDPGKPEDIGTSTCTTDTSNSVQNTTTSSTSAENNMTDTSFSTSARVDNANSSGNVMSKTLLQENPMVMHSLPIHDEAEGSAVKKTKASISGRCDGSELSHFISDKEICSFLKSTLGFDTVEKFASADRFDIARRLFSWYEERTVKDGGGGTGRVSIGCQARPLKVLEARVFSWRLQMNKIRAHHGLPLLSAGENTAPVESRSVGNAKSVSKGSSAAAADSEEASSNEAESANTRKKPPNDTGDKPRSKKIPEELSSAKESTAALNILSGVDDLLTVLSEEECRFLGSKFWIFTVQQLESVLARDDTTMKDTEVETSTPLRVAKCHLVDAIMKEIAKVAESSSNSSDLASVIPTQERKEGTEIEKRQISAEALTLKWKMNLDARKKPSSDDVIRFFSLDGALSVLIPPALIQFLKAVGIDTAYGLIAARKTENSLLIALFKLWQEKQGMKPIRAQNIARFLTSLSSRVQSAITSVAPADSFTRAWSGSNLIALTSSAREFIVFQCRYSDDKSFLEEQTGNIAKKLGNYRAEKGMPVLKGTGNVAVISSWRTIVKDNSDLEESLRRLLPIVTLDIKTIVASRNNGAGRSKGKANSPASTRGRKQRVSNTSVAAQRAKTGPGIKNLKPPQGHLSDDISLVMHELQSNDFMLRVLKPSQAKFLQSTGIFNADSLIRADKSEKSAMVQSLIRWRRDRGFDEIPAASASKAIADWSRKVETELNAIKQKRKKDLEGGNETVVFKNDSTGKRSGDSDQSRQTKKKKRVVAKKFLEHSGLDPIEALSSSAREFLSTLGVTTAEDFLSETTSDLGSAFVSWRARTGLDELKGAGAISIVSGWKGQVRDVCEYLGKQTLIDLDAAVRKKSLSGGGAASSSGGSSSSSSSRKGGLSQLPYSALSRSSEALIEDEPLGPNVLDKPEDRFVSKPGILNGLSSRNFTVRGNGKDATLYDFQLSIRSRDGAVNESSNKKEGDDVAQQDNFAVCLTYRGARINRSSIYFNEDTDSKAGDLLSHSHSPSTPPITFPILSHCSLSGHQGDTTTSSGGEPFEKSHIPFCSFAAPSPAKSEGGGLVDLTRFHIFPSSQRKISERNDYASGILEAFVEGRGGVRGGGNAVSKDNLDGDSETEVNANVSIVLDSATGEEQYLLCLANPIEKGQTLELVPSNTTTLAPASLNTKSYLGNPSDYRSRHGVFSLIESMNAIQLLNTLEVLEKKQEVVTEQMRRIIMHEHISTTENQSQEASAMSIGAESGDCKKSDKDLLPTSVLISRRRIHFVASTILRQVKALLKEDRLSQLDRSTLTSTNGRLDKLLWDKVCVEVTGSTTEGSGERSTVLYEQLEKEITNELHFSLACQQAVGPRCPLSSQLDGVNSQLIARYALTTAGSNSGQNQQALIKEMYLAAQKSAKDLQSCSEAKSQDDILRLILPCKSVIDSHRHISHLPRGLPIHLASSLPTLSYTSIGETSFQYPPPNDTSRKESEDSFIVLKADSGFSFTSMVLLLNKRSESDLSLLMGALTSSTRRLDLSVDSSWYLQNQIIVPTDEMAQSGLVSWCRPIHALCAPSYSLKDLTEAVFRSLGDMTIAQPDDSVDSAYGSNRDLARTITLHLPTSDVAAFARATRADYYPKTLPIFLRILFPHLEQKFSWKVHCGRSLDSLTYLPPETLDKRRKDASFDFTASEKRRKKTLLKMRRANAPKLPRKLRQIFSTFAKSVAKIDDADGLANVEQKADDNGDSANDAATNEPRADAGSSEMAAAAGKPAKDVIESFVESIDFKGDESKGAVMTAMAQSILTMFDKTIPPSFPSGPSNARDPNEDISDDQSTSTRSRTKPPRESYCAEYLLWWMILLPDLLVKAGLPLRQQQLIEGFVEALFLYCSESHSEIFTMFDYSDSIAIDDESADAVDISQLVLGIIEKASEETKNDEDSNRSASTDKADGNDQHDNADEEFSTTVLRDHERHLLTDFVCHALDQVQLCFLREEDLSSGKRGTFHVGYPGMVCKHCKEAKMFYSNVSSLSACAPGIHVHCQRCKRCPKKIVDEMNEKKKLHNPQKKTLKMGNMAKFYHSLHKRMMRMRRATDGGAFLDESSSDESSDEDDTESVDQTAAEDDAQDGSNGDDVFFDHIDAIASIAEDKFYQRRNITSAIDLYYQCVERGGLVWKTDALPRSLPDEMMSEWLLKLILRRLNRGLPLISTAPIEKETSPNVSTHSVSTSVYRSTSPPNNNGNYTACSIEGCSKHRQSKCDGMCRAHWSLMQKTGVRPGAVNSTKNHATKRKSTSPGVGIEKQKGSYNSWSCHQCGEDNDPESQRCSGCKGWRGGKRRFTQSSTSSGTPEVKLLEKIPWTCHLCGKENPGTKQRCTHPCRAWRGGKRLHL